MLEQVLRELRPLCTSEQQFIEKFFQLSRDTTELPVLGVSARTTSSPAPLASPPFSRQSGVAAHRCRTPELSWALVTGVSSGEA